MKRFSQSILHKALPLAFSIVAVAPQLHAATIVKANNTNALNLGTSWVGGIVPDVGGLDSVLWNNTVLGANTVALGGSLNWAGITIANPGGAVVLTHAAGNVLTLGAGGIDLSAATQNLTVMNSANIAGTLTISAPQTWNVASARTLTLFNTSNTATTALSGSSNIQVSGAGVVAMNVGDSTSTAFTGGGNSAFSGNWTIGTGTAGTGRVNTLRNGANAWGTGTITLNGGTIAQTAGNWTWTNNITLSSGVTSTIDEANASGSRTLKLQGVLSGDGGLTFAETGGGSHSVDGGFILTNNNTLSGTVTINAGAVVRIGGVPGNDTTTVVGSGGTLGTAAITNNGTLTLSRNNTWTFANTVSGSGLLRIGLNAGSGTHIVTVSGNNSHTGGTTLQSAVTLKIGHANAMGTGTFTIAGDGIFDNATGSALTVANNLTMSAGSPTFTGTDDMTINGAVLISGANRNITVTNVGKTLTLGGNIGQDVAGRTFTKNGPGTMVLSGASNTYDGGTIINDGYLRFGSTSLPATGTVFMNGGGSLVADGPFLTIMDWLGSGRINTGSAGSIAIPGNSAESINFSSHPTLGLSTSAAAATFSGTITGTARYRFGGESNTTLTIASALSGANDLNKFDAGTLILAGTNSYTGGTTLAGGTTIVDNITNGGVSGALGAATSANDRLRFESSSPATLRYVGTGHTTDRSFTIVPNATGIIEASGTGALIFDGTGGAMGFNAATGTRTLVLGGTSASGIVNQMNVAIGDNTGATSLTKNGSGTWRLGGANTYTGTTTINDGLLIAAGGSAIGDTSAVVLANAAGATLRLDANETIGAFSGGGALGGTVNLNGNDLTISPAVNTDYNGILIGSGSLIKNGTGQLRLGGLTGTPGSSTFSGTHLINAGLLIFTSAGSDDGTPNATINGDANSGIVIGDTFVGGNLNIGALSGTGGKIRVDWNPLAGQRTLSVTQNTDTTFAGVFEDFTGGRIVGLTKNGSGTLTLSGLSTVMTGTTTINAGTLHVTGSISASATTVLGGTLSGTGTVGTLSVNAGGTVAPGASPGILNAGSTTFNGGTLALEINSANAGSGYDQLNVIGSVSFLANTPLTISLGYDPVDDNDVFNIVNNDLSDLVATSARFTYSGTPLLEGDLFTVSGQNFVINYNGGDGNDITLRAVPEPSATAAMLGGLGLLLGLRRRKARSANH